MLMRADEVGMRKVILRCSLDSWFAVDPVERCVAASFRNCPRVEVRHTDRFSDRFGVNLWIIGGDDNVCSRCSPLGQNEFGF